MDSEEEEEEIIDLQLCSDKILVWNADDVKMIQGKHHIVGKLIGCLPRAPQQNSQLGLPLQLMPEEAAVLIEYGVARIIRMKVMTPTVEDVEKFKEDRLNSFMEQTRIFKLEKESKKADILKKNQSAYGKKRKQLRKERARSRKMLLSGKLEKPVEESHTSMLLKDCNLNSGLKATTVLNVNKEGLPSEKPTADEGTGNADLKEDAGIDNIDSIRMPRVDGRGEEHNIDNRENSNRKLEDLGKSCKREMDKDDSENNEVKRQKIVLNRDGDGNDGVRATTGISDNFAERSGLNIKEIEHGKLQSSETESKGEYGVKNHDSLNKTMHVENDANITDNVRDSSMNEDKQTIDNVDSKLECKSTVCDVVCNPSNTVGKDTRNESMVTKDSESGKMNKKEENNTSKGYQGCLIHLPTCAAKFGKIPVEEWNYPSSETEWLRFRVFKDFWEKGYYLTSGGKFGGDFLVYPGSPLLFHSSFIAICRPHTESFTARELVQFGRMASNVKKTVVICSIHTQDELVFTSVQWTGIS